MTFASISLATPLRFANPRLPPTPTSSPLASCSLHLAYPSLLLWKTSDKAAYNERLGLLKHPFPEFCPWARNKTLCQKKEDLTEEFQTLVGRACILGRKAHFQFSLTHTHTHTHTHVHMYTQAQLGNYTVCLFKCQLWWVQIFLKVGLSEMLLNCLIGGGNEAREVMLFPAGERAFFSLVKKKKILTHQDGFQCIFSTENTLSRWDF